MIRYFLSQISTLLLVVNLEHTKITTLELEAEGKDDLDFSLNILVLGKCGVGKSSTINSIFGEEKANISSFEPGTTSVREITGIVDGVKIKIIVTPGLKSSIMEQPFNRKILSSVKNLIKKIPPDIVLYVDRLDTQTQNLYDYPLLKTITATLGQPIWRQTVVALSHAAAAPPDGQNGYPLSYRESVAQRSNVVEQSIRKAAGGDLGLMNMIYVENNYLCRKNRYGEIVLPNGIVWRPQLLLLCYSMKFWDLTNLISKIPDPFDHVRRLLGFPVRLLPLNHFLSSMLETRAHPKLPADNFEPSDFSDSDNENEENIHEYDQLPSFKPLRKKQIEKLSKEQKKAYFEEFDYRVKLLQKKQWKEAVKRVKEMREKGEEEEEEEEGAEAMPLPDMVLPPSFDIDNPTYRYRILEPTRHSWQVLAKPASDSWDHDCGYDGITLEKSLAIANKFLGFISVEMTKDKKEFSINLDTSLATKYGKKGSAMAVLEIQQILEQLAYTFRGETKFKIFKKNNTAAGISVTFLGENIVAGVKIEDQIEIGKQWAMIGSVGTVRCRGDGAYGTSFEVQRREKDYPIGGIQSAFGLSLKKWRGDWDVWLTSLAQFAIGRNSEVSLRGGINKKFNGQITVTTSSSDHLSLVLVGIIPIFSAIFKKIWPAAGDNYSMYF